METKIDEKVFGSPKDMFDLLEAFFRNYTGQDGISVSPINSRNKLDCFCGNPSVDDTLKLHDPSVALQNMTEADMEIAIEKTGVQDNAFFEYEKVPGGAVFHPTQSHKELKLGTPVEITSVSGTGEEGEPNEPTIITIEGLTASTYHLIKLYVESPCVVTLSSDLTSPLNAELELAAGMNMFLFYADAEATDETISLQCGGANITGLTNDNKSDRIKCWEVDDFEINELFAVVN